jgi:hypothetical protein
MTRKDTSKGDRALELYEKGIKPILIQERLGVRAGHLQAMLQQARARRDKKAAEVKE